eukprot:3338051-Pyramimonas_sp.AAC.1
MAMDCYRPVKQVGGIWFSHLINVKTTINSLSKFREGWGSSILTRKAVLADNSIKALFQSRVENQRDGCRLGCMS